MSSRFVVPIDVIISLVLPGRGDRRAESRLPVPRQGLCGLLTLLSPGHAALGAFRPAFVCDGLALGLRQLRLGERGLGLRLAAAGVLDPAERGQ